MKNKRYLVSGIVCYNDYYRVQKLIQKLLLHDVGNSCNHIILVLDNSELRGTDYYIFRTWIKKLSNVRYIQSKKNSGSSGGFRKIMTFAVRVSVKFKSQNVLVWLHDSDGFPMANCFNELYTCINDGSDIAVPSILDDENKKNKSFARSTVFGPISRKVSTASKRKIDYFGTAGVLMHIRVVNQFGKYLEQPYFFTNLEDYEYGLRVSRGGGSIVLSGKALYYHPRMEHRLPFPLSITPIMLQIKKIDNRRQNMSTLSGIYIYKKYYGKNWFFLIFAITKLMSILIDNRSKYYSFGECMKIFEEISCEK